MTNRFSQCIINLPNNSGFSLTEQTLAFLLSHRTFNNKIPYKARTNPKHLFLEYSHCDIHQHVDRIEVRSTVWGTIA